MRNCGIGAAAALVLLLAMPIAAPTVLSVAAAEETGQSDTLIDRLVEAAAEGEDSPEELAEQLALPIGGEGGLSFDSDDRIVMMVMFSGAPDDSTLDLIGEIGEVQGVQRASATATVHIAPSRVADLLEIAGVGGAIPAIAPLAGSIARGDATAALKTELASALSGAAPATGALPAANRPDGTLCGPIAIEADAPLRADEARESFGVDGTGVTIGIISDSYDVSATARTSAADDIVSGALPGTANPCGRHLEVEVLSDGGPEASDEGRAMAQLVHGIAPGAQLLFANAGAHEGVMADNIAALVEAGADIIVDDISFPTEFSYQQGIVSVEINEARSQGVAYFTSAGNSVALGTHGASDGLPVSSWQTKAYRPTACPSWVVTGPTDPLNGAAVDCLDFDPVEADAVSTPYDTLFIDGAVGDDPQQLIAVGSVGEAFLAASTDYEWRFFEVDPVTADVELIGDSMPRISSLHANFLGAVNVNPGTEVRMVMVRKGFDPAESAPAVFTMFIRGGDAIAQRAHMGDNVRDWVGETVFGHGADGSATSVSSLYWGEPTRVREYSSLGPGTLLFEPISKTELEPAERLSSPVRVDTPHLAAVDGTVTTFFGGDEGTPDAPEYRFYGTSAAAPNAAAAAALALSYAPGLSGAELTDLIIDTAAHDVVNPYPLRFDDANVFGAGRVDAMAMLEALPAAPFISHIFGVADETELTIGWEPGASDHFVIVIYLGSVAPQNAIEASQLPGGTDEYTFTGLEPDTEYTVVLTPYGEYGVEGEAADISMRTMAATGGGGGSEVEGDRTSTTGSPSDRLSHTGASDQLPWLIGAGALLVLGAGAVVVSVVRRSSRERANSEEL